MNFYQQIHQMQSNTDINTSVMNIQTQPWWGVPVVAGVFLLLGSLATFLTSLHNAKRTGKALIESQLSGKVVDLISIGDEIHKLALLLLPRDPHAGADLVTKNGLNLIDKFTKVSLEIDLIIPAVLVKPCRKYQAATLSLLMPPLAAEILDHKLRNHNESNRLFVNAIRSRRGLPDLPRSEQNSETLMEAVELPLAMLRDWLRESKSSQPTSAAEPNSPNTHPEQTKDGNLD